MIANVRQCGLSGGHSSDPFSIDEPDTRNKLGQGSREDEWMLWGGTQRGMYRGRDVCTTGTKGARNTRGFRLGNRQDS